MVLMALMLAGPTRGHGANAPPATVKDCPDCPELVLIPAGNFAMGVAGGEEDAADVPIEFRGWSYPPHAVHIAAPFYLGRHDVTRGQFSAFVKATGREPDGCKAGRSWREPGFTQTDDHPVVCVSAEDADAYVRWLSSRTGRAYRLPSEAEWEYAARSGTTTPRYWGSGNAGLCAHAATGGCLLTGTTSVGHFAPNGFGLYDMLGDVWQWTADCWHNSYNGAPGDGSAWLRGDCQLRVVRGGSWSGGSWALRAGGRDADRVDYRESDVGFRVARALTP
jgi:formylglycine-generating enzyme required for sulfatase activity